MQSACLGLADCSKKGWSSLHHEKFHINVKNPLFSPISAVCEDSVLRPLASVGRRNEAPLPGAGKSHKKGQCEPQPSSLCPRPGRGCRTVPPYLQRAPAGQLGAVAALGGHAGVAGADEHRGADVQRGPLGVHHAVQRVQRRGDAELPQALPPRLGHLGDLGPLGDSGPGLRGHALRLRGPVALGGLQELLGRAGLEETAGDGMGWAVRGYPWHSSPCSAPLPLQSCFNL